MKVIHLSRESSHVESPYRPVLAGKDFPLMREEAFADAFCEVWSDIDVIVLDALFSPDGAPEDSFGGIRLLKLLRMKGLRQHAVVYSPFPLSYLLRQGHHEILLSSGTSYEWLPERIDEAMCRERVGRLAEEDLSVYFLPEYNGLLRMERHSLANWWGVLRLHHAMDALGLLPEGQHDPGLEEALSREQSYPGRLMSYVRFRGARPQVVFPGETAETLLARIENLRSRRPRVVYVDDQASDGWAALLQDLLYGDECPERFITPAIPPSEPDPESLANQIRAASPDIVILDMRLSSGDRGPLPTGLELVRLLSEPGKEIGCPILAFTASNKRAVSERAVSLGADAVWTKEGIDESEQFNTQEYLQFTMERFSALVSTLEQFQGEERRLLYESVRAVNEMESTAGHFWWEKSQWYPDDETVHTPVPRGLLVGRLRNVFASFKKGLAAEAEAPDENIYSKLTIELCWILEAVYETSNLSVGLNERTEACWPQGSDAFRLARRLVEVRNSAAHSRSFGDGGMALDGFTKAVGGMMRFLTMDTAQTTRGETVVGKLVREEESPGGFCLRTEGMKYFFRERDAASCEALYGDTLHRRSVTASLRPPVSRYDFLTLDLTARQPVTGRQWSMSVKPVLLTGYTVLLETSAVYPRKDALFHAEQALPEGVKDGDTLYFNLFCVDSVREGASLRISNITLQPQEDRWESTWSGRVRTIFRKEGAVYVEFVFLTPPHHWSFRIPRIQWEEKDGTARWAFFLPDWRQSPCVSSPRIPEGEDK